MSVPAYVQAAFDRLARAKAIRDGKKADFEAVSDRVDAAEATLRKAQATYLDTPEDAAVNEALILARALRDQVGEEQKDAARWCYAAQDNVDAAEAAYQQARRWAASAIIDSSARRLVEISIRVDALAGELAALAQEGHRHDQLIANETRALGIISPPGWRQSLTSTLTSHAEQIGQGHAPVTLGLHARADHKANWLGPQLELPPQKDAE